MKLRLPSLFLTSSLLALNYTYSVSCGNDTPNKSEITKVHVVFKTHLDIGFTKLGKEILNTYKTDFIPAALTLTEQNRKGDQVFYPWTTGSWLLSEYLKGATPENKERMKQALTRGEFNYHALPFTLQVELCDPSLFEAAFEPSRRMDKQFGRKTIAAKVTDVPGITRSAIPILQKQGIELVLIGRNSQAAHPDIPDVFQWKHPDGSKVNVIYQGEYGSDIMLPGTKTAAVLCFTGDNHGPHSPKDIEKIYADIQARYPNAKVTGSSFNDIAKELSTVSSKLPVVTQEMGDTWMYGVASDPRKIADMRALMRLRNRWIKEGKLKRNSDTDMAFAQSLLLVSEHTWGFDVKTFLHNWEKYEFDKFPEFAETDAFKNIEASWKEKQDYIKDAIAALPDSLQQEAKKELASLAPDAPSTEGYETTSCGQVIDAGLFTVKLGNSGSLVSLVEKSTGKEWASPENPLGEFTYQTYSGESYQRFISQYCPPNPAGWAIADYGKPGLDKTSAVEQLWNYQVKEAMVKKGKGGVSLLVELIPIKSTSEKTLPFGAPKRVFVKYDFSAKKPTLDMEVVWKDKSKNRIPEAAWFSFTPKLQNPTLYLDKMGYEVEATDVVSRGARAIHGVSDYIRWKDGKQSVIISTQDAPLVALNSPNILNFDDQSADPKKGAHFCLLNTCWGTNYTQWWGEDMKYKFSFSLK